MSEDSERVFEALCESQGTRLDAFWADILASHGVSRARLQEWIKKGQATVDDKPCLKPGFKLASGQKLTLAAIRLNEPLRPEAGGLCVLYRDEHLAVLDKPAGLTVHPAPSCPENTLVGRLLAEFPELSSQDSLRPGIVHRLDKDTSGLIIVALDERTAQALARDFAARKVKKTYLALAHGKPKQPSAEINLPIGRDPRHKTRMAVLAKGGRNALSRYTTVWSAPDASASLLKVEIATGRTHQIRVHLSHIGHPLLGDALYGPAEHSELARQGGCLAKLAKRQMLHAWRLGFKHPQNAEDMSFTCAPPRDFSRLPLLLGRETQKVGITGLPGSGKSALLNLASQAGFPVFDSDQVVAGLYQPGADGWAILRQRFGSRFIESDKSGVNKRALFAACLESDKLRRELNDLIHPLVLHRLREFWRENSRARAAFAEVPLLFEAGKGFSDGFSAIIGLDAPESERFSRLLARGLSLEAAQRLCSWHLPAEAKFKACTHVLANDSSLEALAECFMSLLQVLAIKRRGLAKGFAERLNAYFQGQSLHP